MKITHAEHAILLWTAAGVISGFGWFAIALVASGDSAGLWPVIPMSFGVSAMAFGMGVAEFVLAHLKSTGYTVTDEGRVIRGETPA